jgi:hypothetical protein
MFALSIEKIDFLIFSYFNLRVHLSALITEDITEFISDRAEINFFENSIVELKMFRTFLI